MTKFNAFILACILSFSFAVLLNHPVAEETVSKQHIDTLLSQTVTPDYIEKHIQQALEEDNVDLAKAYLSLAEMMKLPVSLELQTEVEEQGSFLYESYRQTKEFLTGAITGEGNSTASISGSVVADFTVVGDVRDLAIETKHYMADEPVDELVAGLSAVGLALSAGTVFSWGTAGVFTVPAKASVSLMKYAAKTSRLTRGFRQYLTDVLARSVNLQPIYKKVSGFKTMDHWSVREFKALEKVTSDNVHLTEIEKVSNSVSTIQDAVGTTASTLTLLGYVQNVRSLKMVKRFAKLYGKRSAVILKVLGKQAFRVTKFSVKRFAKLFFAIMAGIYSLIAAWFSRCLFRRLWHLLS